MSISKEQVAKVAGLARLELSDQELEQFTKELISILDYVERLNSVNTEGIEPLTHPIDQAEFVALRPDEIKESAELETFRGSFLNLAPETEGSFFKVPKMRK